MNSRDMCMIDHLDDLMAAGVDCLKIEGRAKSAYYAAIVTGVPALFGRRGRRAPA